MVLVIVVVVRSGSIQSHPGQATQRNTKAKQPWTRDHSLLLQVASARASFSSRVASLSAQGITSSAAAGDDEEMIVRSQDQSCTGVQQVQGVNCAQQERVGAVLKMGGRLDG